MERLTLKENEDIDSNIHPAIKRLLKEHSSNKKTYKSTTRKDNNISSFDTEILKEEPGFNLHTATSIVKTSRRTSYFSNSSTKDLINLNVQLESNKHLRTNKRRSTIYISGEEINNAKLQYNMECLEGLLTKKRQRSNSKTPELNSYESSKSVKTVKCNKSEISK